MKCQKCGYERRPQDDDFFPSTECPYCGIIYTKLKEQSTTSPENITPDSHPEEIPASVEPPAVSGRLPSLSENQPESAPVSLTQSDKAKDGSAPCPRRQQLTTPPMEPTAYPSSIPRPTRSRFSLSPLSTQFERQAPPVKPRMKKTVTASPEEENTFRPRQTSHPLPTSAVVKHHTAITLTPKKKAAHIKKENARREKAIKKQQIRVEKNKKRKERIARQRRASFQRRYANTLSLEAAAVRKVCAEMVRKISGQSPDHPAQGPESGLLTDNYIIRFSGIIGWGVLIFGGIGSVVIWGATAMAERMPPQLAAPQHLSGAIGIFLGFACLLAGIFGCAFCLLSGYLTRSMAEIREAVSGQRTDANRHTLGCDGDCAREAPKLVDSAAR